jgi:hypothetical protein
MMMPLQPAAEFSKGAAVPSFRGLGTARELLQQRTEQPLVQRPGRALLLSRCDLC